MFYSKNLKKINKIRHCFFSRKGGVSKEIYKSLNCGKGSKDNKLKVRRNLKLVSKKIKVKLENLKLMNQTHSNKVLVVNNNNKKFKSFNSDAIITSIKGLALGVVTADCVPIILYDYKSETIGCIHAGWKGAFSGIIENTIKKFRKLNLKNKIFASIGPCIGKKSYEVDFDFYKKFILKSKKNKIYFSIKNDNKKLFDLRKYVNDKLLKLNIKVDHVNRDTFKEKNSFFSYRRSKKLQEKDYGRCISVISLIK
tara:strand:- start:2473 stop:3231 length:759 start_codon:yes stop_codon:yes gene_type:complete